MQEAPPTDPFRFEPLRALRALSALARDPDDLPKVFTIIEAFSGRAPVWLHRRFERSASGRRLLADRPNLGAILADRAALRAMPEGSLARAYLAFVESEGISAEGIVDASMRGRAGGPVGTSGPEFVQVRMRDTHDLWHAVTGYKGDLLGESALLAFTFAQTHNPGVALIVALALLKARGERALILDGFRRGRRSAWLVAQPWEALLPLPLEEVRRTLRLDAPAAYAPLRTAEARLQGHLSPWALGRPGPRRP